MSMSVICTMLYACFVFLFFAVVLGKYLIFIVLRMFMSNKSFGYPKNRAQIGEYFHSSFEFSQSFTSVKIAL